MGPAGPIATVGKDRGCVGRRTGAACLAACAARGFRLMRRVVLFGEDDAHQKIIDALVRRLADEKRIDVQLHWRSAVGGYSRVVAEFKAYQRELLRHRVRRFDAIVVATDANCKGNRRREEFRDLAGDVDVVLAVPDPHIERWLLLDSSAFKKVLGKGCSAPDQKCDRDLYKQRYAQSVYAAGIEPVFGGLEHAQSIVSEMNLDRVARHDRSLRNFLRDIRTVMQSWRP